MTLIRTKNSLKSVFYITGFGFNEIKRFTRFKQKLF